MKDLTPIPGGLHRDEHRRFYLSDEQRRWFEDAVRNEYMRRIRLRQDVYTIPRTGRFVTDDPKTFYYDKHTKRHKIMEQHMVAEGYVFKPLSSRSSGHSSDCPADHSLREWML